MLPYYILAIIIIPTHAVVKVFMSSILVSPFSCFRKILAVSAVFLSSFQCYTQSEVISTLLVNPKTPESIRG
jgi:hypothetical protein